MDNSEISAQPTTGDGRSLDDLPTPRRKLTAPMVPDGPEPQLAWSATWRVSHSPWPGSTGHSARLDVFSWRGLTRPAEAAQCRARSPRCTPGSAAPPPGCSSCTPDSPARSPRRRAAIVQARDGGINLGHRPGDVRHGFRWVSPGGFIAIVLWLAASALFAVYIANFSHYNKIYGSLAGVIIFLIWMWISNVAILLGAEFNAELERGRAVAAGHFTGRFRAVFRRICGNQQRRGPPPGGAVRRPAGRARRRWRDPPGLVPPLSFTARAWPVLRLAR